MKANTGMSLAKKAKTTVSFSDVINAPTNRALLDKTLGDPKRATRLVATLVAAVADSDRLRGCKPETIISAALKGEALNLDLSLQHFSLVPYGNICTYVPSRKGLLQLAIRTGQYEDIDAIDIREGEYLGREGATGRPKFKFEPDEDKREQLPVIGYYAYFRLNSGFFKGFYWSMQKLLKHADRYSAAFSLDIYNKYKSGQTLTEDERRQVDNGPWYGKTGAQDAMCIKTVLKDMLRSGYAPLSAELVDAMNADDDEKPISVYSKSPKMEYAPTSQVTSDVATIGEVAETGVEVEDKPVSAQKDAYTMFFGGDTDDGNTAE